MGRRIIYIKKAEIVSRYYLGEYVGRDSTWKEQEVFQSPQELVDYLGNNNEKYASELRRRKNLGIIVNVPNAEGESLVQALNLIKPKFGNVFIRKAPSNNNH